MLLKEKELQERKSRSLALRVSDLQRQLDDQVADRMESPTPERLHQENKALRELLIKAAEKAGEDQKMLGFLRQVSNSGSKASE